MSDLLDLMDPAVDQVGEHHHPEHARDTELAGAAQTRVGSGRRRLHVLAVLARAPLGLTDAELAILTGQHRAAARRHELTAAGWVEDSGDRRPTGLGGTAIVWVLSPLGRCEYDRL